jgi:tetratricopeptide (TPR) repeat protein
LEKILDKLDIEQTEFIHDPEVAKARNHLIIAEEYVQRGYLEKAEKTFRYSVETYPHYMVGWLKLGRFYESQHQWALALEIYQDTLRRFPKCVDASNAIGRVLKKTYRYEEALQQFQTSLEIEKSNAFALANINEIQSFLEINSIDTTEDIDDLKKLVKNLLKELN